MENGGPTWAAVLNFAAASVIFFISATSMSVSTVGTPNAGIVP
jgi:hypothetical protein